MEPENYESYESLEQHTPSDYQGVVMMLQTYYFRSIELFRKVHENELQKRYDIRLDALTQSFMITTINLFKEYAAVKKNVEVKKIFDSAIKLCESDKKIVAYNGMKRCRDALIKANFLLGLSKIDLVKDDKNPAKIKYSQNPTRTDMTWNDI